jgi:hypothetical protein
MSLSTERNAGLASQLATVEVPRFNTIRQDPNPILAAHMLQEIYKMVTDWQAELEDLDRQILNVNATGPVVSGWLEARRSKVSNTGEEIPTPYKTIDPNGLATIDPDLGYRLCGLNEFGELWTRPCAMSEILSISQAIARYQQLKDLTDRKQQVEQYIRHILEDLVHLRMKLQD